MEKWHALLAIGVILLAYAGYLYYFAPEIKLAVQDSPLNTISPAASVTLSSQNFSAVQGLCTLTITPSDGYLINATLTIITDDPQAAIKAYSALPLETLSGGTGNMTLLIPVTNNELSLDILFTFTNQTITHEVSFEIVAQGINPTSITVYGNPS
mgnify:CR=1 FL=1